jgi:two-component system CheB/CheR fusion protein
VQNAFEKTNLDDILKNVIADFDLLITEKKAVIHHDQLPVIRAIPFQVNQLFYNLLSNAFKFSDAARLPVINITSRLLPVEEVQKMPLLRAKCPYYEIVFRDNGIGFDEQFAEQVFLIFHRLHSREHFEGTGIGLALCKKIVVNHHGEIYAVAKKGEGAAFHIILPEEQ